jgi:hypothetical protein
LVALLSNAPFPGFGLHRSSVRLSARCFFGQFRPARSRIACVALAGFGNGVWYRSVGPLLMLSFLTGPAESSRVRARAFPLRLSASSLASVFNRHPPPPNNSFKPTPHRGVNSVLYATLHAVATPLRGGLTQALGGSNPYTVHRDRLARRPRHFRPAAGFNRYARWHQCLCIASASSQCALIYLVRYACLLR